jgi:hypothetical protein
MSKIALSGNASGTGTFTIASPNSNSDRTLNLPDSAGTLATQEYVGTQALGVGQTWQNVTASRAVGTTYTNTTGRPIVVSIATTAPAPVLSLLTVNGLTVSWQQVGGERNTVSAVVPNGNTYVLGQIFGSLSAADWFELR